MTTLFGEWTGLLLRSRRSHQEKMRILAIWAVGCLAAGFAIHPWCPIIKRICTTSFTLHSAGWVLLIVVGVNSMFIYLVDNASGGVCAVR